MKGKHADLARLQHILDAISEIEEYTEGFDLKKFKSDSKTKFASVKQLEIIGEAANHVSINLQKKFPEIAWKPIRSFRNILVHEYFGIHSETVWNTIQFDLPTLKIQIQKIINEVFN